LHNRSDNFAE